MTLLTKTEAAQRARLHPETLNRLIREGRGPALTILGAKAMIREDRLQAWIEDATHRRTKPVAA